MYHVRVVATGSGAKAVQVIRYIRRKRVVVHHVGSAHDDAEVDALLSAAQEWIAQQTHQLPAFPDTMFFYSINASIWAFTIRSCSTFSTDCNKVSDTRTLTHLHY